jgi:hypothetical protein
MMATRGALYENWLHGRHADVDGTGRDTIDDMIAG